MSVNWETVQTNVVTAIIIGALSVAGAIIWRGATTVDQKVDAASEAQAAHTIALQEQNEALKKQTDYMKKAVDALEGEVIDAKAQDKAIIEALNDLRHLIEQKHGSPKEEELKAPEVPEREFIQKKLPRIDIRQMSPIDMPRR